jgi:aspartate racemase
VLAFADKEDYKGLTNYLLQGLQNLKNAGVQFASLTGMTPHLVINELNKKSPIPIVNMLSTAKNYVIKNNYKKVAL